MLCQIKDICTSVYSGGTPKSTVSEYYSSYGIPWLNTKEINFNRIFDTEKYITQAGYDSSAAKWVEKNAVIVAMYGATAGKSCITKIRLTTNQACCNLIINEKVADYLYVYYYLKYKYTELSGLANGGAQQNLNSQIIKEFPISIPSLEVQKKISSVLASLDDKIESNQQINRNLAAQAQAIYQSWFIDFEPWGGICPNDWKTYTFSSFLRVRNEKSNDPNIPLFSVTDTGIMPREAKFTKKLSTSSTKNKVIYCGDLVFGMSREILNWGIMHSPIGGVSSAYNVFEVGANIDVRYLESYMKIKRQYFHDIIKPASREGQGIDKSILLNKKIYVPTSEILNSYYKIDENYTQLIHVLETENQQLISLRDALLPRLMSGELDVSELDI